MAVSVNGKENQLTRVLVIAREDPSTLKLISGLSGGGFHPLLATTIIRALKLCETESPSIVVLDFSLPLHTDMQLKEFAKNCKGNLHVPLIALLSVDKMANFDFTLGADDIMSAPPEATEALARIKQLLAKSHVHVSKNVLSFGDLVIDTDRYEVSLAGESVELTFKEYELLKFLAVSPGRVFTREVMLNKVWGYDYFGGTRTVDVHVRRLRSKIEDAGHTFIDTVRNVGYRFKDK